MPFALVGIVVQLASSPAMADPDSPYFSQPMFDQQMRQQRAAQPGGEWNNAKVNVPSYVASATGVLGPPIPGLDTVTTGQGAAATQAIPGIAGAMNATQAAIGAPMGTLGVTSGTAASSGGFSAANSASVATGAALGVLKAVP